MSEDLRKINQLSFKGKTKSFSNYRKYISEHFYLMAAYGLVFPKDIQNNCPDFLNPISISDFILDLKDLGMKGTDADFRKLIGSERIPRLSALNILEEQLKKKDNGWDGKDRIEDLVKSLNLDGDFKRTLRLIKKWLFNTYARAFQHINKEIKFKVYSRVVLILHSDQRAFGKTEFFRKIGMSGKMNEFFKLKGFELYGESQGELPSDKRKLNNYLAECLIYQIDDIDNLIIKGGGPLRSIISSDTITERMLYEQKNFYRFRTAGICGTTNNSTTLRDPNENRYMMFTMNKAIDRNLINSIDIIQLWAQIRNQVMRLGADSCNFEHKDFKEIIENSSSYLYTTPLEDYLAEWLKFDPEGSMTFDEIKDKVRVNNFQVSDTQIGTALKLICPEGETPKFRKYKNGKRPRYYKFIYKSEYMNKLAGQDDLYKDLPF